MKTKRALLFDLLGKNISILRCPICMSELSYNNDSLICSKRHLFDISKKGTVLLHKKYQKKIDSIYTKELFENRRFFIKAGFYTEIYNYISDLIFGNSNNPKILDLGSGECSHLQRIKNNRDITAIGIDLSYDAINLATDYLVDGILPICCDLFNLPFKNKVFDVVLNFLSPINSFEADRILKDDGIIIKVIPTKNYLKELRSYLGFQEYSKEVEILSNLQEHYSISSIERIENIKPLTEETVSSLFYMTPMTNHSENIIKSINNANFDQITISLDIVLLRKKHIQVQ